MYSHNCLAVETSKLGGTESNHQTLSIVPEDLQKLSPSELSQKIYNTETSHKLLEEKPWKNDKTYFENAFISSLALMKMSIHARSGGSIEIMGMMTGKIMNKSIVVTDVYALPVEGTETRVNAQNEAYEYMVQYLEGSNKIGRNDNIVGWYHSHPGYGCWLSGIDVATQSLNQSFQDPYLAVVVDPEKTISKGRVEIGAFRTFPENASDDTNDIEPSKQSFSDATKSHSSFSHIPKSKIKDFGAHSDKYYSLKVTIFKSDLDNGILDVLMNKYWTSTIANISGDDVSGEKNKKDFFIQKMLDITNRIKAEEPSRNNKLDKQAADIYNSMNQEIKNNRNKNQQLEVEDDDDISDDDTFEQPADTESQEFDHDRTNYSPLEEGSSPRLDAYPTLKRKTKGWRFSSQDTRNRKMNDQRESNRALDKISRDARALGSEEIRNILTLKIQQQMFLGS